MESHAYHETREMTWPNVAFKYCGLFDHFIHIESEEARMLPKINTAHLARLTDNFGVIQFSKQWIPDASSGYTLDDNARALLVCVKHFEKFREYKQLNLIRTYLNYFKYVQDKDGKLYNFVSENKTVDKGSWGEDAQGRAIWALGFLIDAPHVPADFKREAHEIFVKALGTVEEIKSPRAVAFIIQGLYHYDKEMKYKEIKERVIKFADYLAGLYEASSGDNWKWFEKYLTYGNSKLSEALFYAYSATGKDEYLDIANESLGFLIEKNF